MWPIVLKSHGLYKWSCHELYLSFLIPQSRWLVCHVLLRSCDSLMCKVTDSTNDLVTNPIYHYLFLIGHVAHWFEEAQTLQTIMSRTLLIITYSTESVTCLSRTLLRSCDSLIWRVTDSTNDLVTNPTNHYLFHKWLLYHWLFFLFFFNSVTKSLAGTVGWPLQLLGLVLRV